MGPQSSMMGIFIKRRNLDIATEAPGRASCEEEGRDQGDASTSQGMPTIASETPEGSGEAWNRVSPPAS